MMLKWIVDSAQNKAKAISHITSHLLPNSHIFIGSFFIVAISMHFLNGSNFRPRFNGKLYSAMRMYIFTKCHILPDIQNSVLYSATSNLSVTYHSIHEKCVTEIKDDNTVQQIEYSSLRKNWSGRIFVVFEFLWILILRNIKRILLIITTNSLFYA